MKQIPKISESEWQIMKLLWAKSPSTANEIVKALSATTAWKPKTIKTLINRLVKKQALGYEKKGRKGDTFLGHLTKGEIVIPKGLAENPDFIKPKSRYLIPYYLALHK